MTHTTTNTKRPLLVVVLGPTGSGKTGLAVALARHFNTEIISTDSRQFYIGMAIGTAQPTTEELAAAPHHLIADRLPEEELSAGGYERVALARLEEIFSRNSIAIAVGGSGLYIDALCSGFDELPCDTAEIRAELMGRLASEGLESLCEELRERDPDYWAVVDRKNPARVVRALEVCIASGLPYSSQRTATRRERPFDVVKIGIDWPREELYDR
ncbi:MAG: tRNA (adenosine(37)-N6)-dimethylallyltransferase MiaA, partial [Tidjanibacter sp.]|nr:tRNA (adenosine(37)-N6)-dimethylallyltransferase MiaA [Tidjanibacter sp.]